MADIDYYAVFGVSPGENAGGKEPELAEPAVAADNAGGKESELAEPTVADGNADSDAAVQMADPGKEATDVAPVEDQDGAAASHDRQGTQSAEERHRQAAARRAAERETLRDEVIASLGLSDPESGQAISTLAEYRAMKERETGAQVEAAAGRLKRSGLERADLDALISSHPSVRAAEQLIARQEEEASARQAAEQERQAQAALDADVAAIGKIDPSVRTLEDLRGRDYMPQMMEYARQGYTLLDSFKLATYGQRQSEIAEAARQAALNRVAGKAHHQPTQSMQGETLLDVPADVMAQYRIFNPHATAEEIRRHYTREMRSAQRGG